MTKTVNEWVEQLQLEPHIEGGYYRQIYKSTDTLSANENERALYTSIYFLLEERNPSHFHRLTADEVWYFHAGQTLSIHMIHPDGRYECVRLGSDIENGSQLQFCVPKGVIFGSSVEEENSYAVVSCMVAPGFEYTDFELLPQKQLLDTYPQHEAIIKKLSK